MATIISYYQDPNRQVISPFDPLRRKQFEPRESVIVLETIEHAISYGEDFYTLAYKYYGQEELWYIIAENNRKLHGDSIPPGFIVYIPSLIVQNSFKTKLTAF